MTYTVDEAAVRRAKARLTLESTALRSAATGVPDAPPGGLSVLVNSVADTLAEDARRDATSFEVAAGNLENAIVLSRLADGLAQSRLGPPFHLVSPGLPDFRNWTRQPGPRGSAP